MAHPNEQRSSVACVVYVRDLNTPPLVNHIEDYISMDLDAGATIYIERHAWRNFSTFMRSALSEGDNIEKAWRRYDQELRGLEDVTV